MIRVGLVVLAMTLPVIAQSEAPKPRAEVIFTRGNIYTGTTDTSTMGAGQRAEAIAIRGDRILAVGPRDAVMKTKGPDTKIVDLVGRFVMPGFNDAHMHLASAGQEKLTVNLVGCKTRRLGRNSVAGEGAPDQMGPR
jgi:hypothetical protein